MAKNNVENNVRPQNKHLKPLKKGETANPNGRPKGQRNYATIYREALKKIADSQNMTPEELETLMEEAGMRQALKGNFQFWKDIRDRIHGQAKNHVQADVNVQLDSETQQMIENALKDM